MIAPLATGLEVALRAAALVGALADGPPVDVQRRGATCEDADLHARIGYYLHSSTATTRSPTTVDAELAREGELWRLDLRVPADGGVRTFRAASCATVIDAAAFVVAVAIDPTVADVIAGPELSDVQDDGGAGSTDAGEAEGVPPPLPLESAPALEAGASDDGTAATEPKPDDRHARVRDVRSTPGDRPPRDAPVPPRTRPAFTLGASGGIQGGSLPLVGGLVRAEVGVLGSRWRADLRGQVRTPSRARAEADPEVGGRIGAWSVGARGCVVFGVRVRGLDVPLCAGVEAGQVFAQGFGFPGARDARLPFTAITFGPALGWAVRPALALVVTAEVGASLLGGELVIEGLQTVHRIGPVFGRGLFGLEGRFRGRSGA